MAPNTNVSGDVCIEDCRSSLPLDSYDVVSPRSNKHDPEDVVILFDWGTLLSLDRVVAITTGCLTLLLDVCTICFVHLVDDTLMASSAIAKHGLCPKYINEEPEIPDDVQAELKELEESVVQLLETALSYGRVVIVTAAETGWVELSASLFMPRLVPFFDTRIKVVSARSTYEYLYPDCPRRWKVEAFNNEVFPVWESYN